MDKLVDIVLFVPTAIFWFFAVWLYIEFMLIFMTVA
jgi:hypothetical protein